MTGSMGILSEAAHSLLDLGAAVLTYFAVKVGDKPADKTHPYGHGKVESVSALIETGLLFLTSFWIIYEAGKRLFENKTEVEVTWYAFAVMFISIAVDFSRSRALKKVAKETNSQALEADALHFSSDILSSAVVIIGLIFSYFGIARADAIAALGVSLFVLHAAYSLGKRTIDVLVDAAPLGLQDEIMQLTQKVEGVVAVPQLRVRPVGPTVFVDMEISVARNLPLETVRAIQQRIGEKIHKKISEADITIEVVPLALTTETIVEKIQIIAHAQGHSVHDIAVHNHSGKRFVSFDLEVDSHATFKEAHAVSTKLENKIKKELGVDFEVSVHIEPLYKTMIDGEEASVDVKKDIEEKINTVITSINTVREYHKLQIRKIDGHFFVSMHVIFSDTEKLEDVHTTASRLEYLIRQADPSIKKVLIHTEPLSDK